jgi:hypothetical protein
MDGLAIVVAALITAADTIAAGHGIGVGHSVAPRLQTDRSERMPYRFGRAG